MITQCWTNVTVILQCDTTKSRHNIRRIKPYKSDTNVEDINIENIYDNFNTLSPAIYFHIILKLGNKVYNRMSTDNFSLIHIGRSREVFL